ncbi:MAG: RsmB/NOP family class I SAM-dependent RNA methyltransferase [Polaromonas sp.]|nr:RsmB/NOP family class I SAM-dependent RNA methyltransferase [Polaromonas sp.]
MHPKALLENCADLLRQVLKFDHPADMVLSRYFREQRLGPRERATLAETVYRVLRKKNLFTYLAQHGNGPPERRLAILGFVADRDYLLGALSDQEKDWLGRCDQVQPSDLLELHRHNLPAWLVEPMKAQLGNEFWPLVESLNAPAALDLRVNTLKEKRADAQKQLAQAAIKSIATPYSPWGLRLADKPQLGQFDIFMRGAVEVQDEGSQLLALLVEAKRGEMIVDFCAGAGGKTLAIGAAMRNTGRLYAFDTSGHRLAALKPRLARSGLSNVHPVAIAHERDDRIKRLAGKIDSVLVDAPCSGLGTLRRNPDLKWRQTPKAIEELHAKQADILQSASRLLKPGGRLVYATCSILSEENESIADAFGSANPGFDLLEAAVLLTRAGVEQAADLCDGPYLRLWPHRHQTDGFFAAVWQKAA